VFVHGWASDLSSWEAQVPAVVAAKQRVIAVDLPGHGRSDHPDAAYTPERLARGVLAVLKQEQVANPVLVGHSMGGLVVRYVAQQMPATRGLVIVDSRSVLFGEGAVNKTQRMAFADALRHDATDDTLRRYLTDFFVEASPQAVRAAVTATALQTDRAAAASEYEGMTNARTWSASPSNIPTLALYGKFATPDSESLLRRLFTRLEYSHWTEPVGHFLMMEKPDRFNDALIGFLKRLDAPR
jgi:pimeloyl-ACP methyl ester carboxylesterase